MAFNMPIPAPPRTPTPPTPISSEPLSGLGIYEGTQDMRSNVNYDPNTLSPTDDVFSSRFSSMNSNMASPAMSSVSPALSSSGGFNSGNMGPPPSASARAPFNFQTQTISTSPVAKSVSSSVLYMHLRYSYTDFKIEHRSKTWSQI